MTFKEMDFELSKAFEELQHNCTLEEFTIHLESIYNKIYQQGREDAISDNVDNYIYPLLDEYDIEQWEYIRYIPLADMWVKLVEQYGGNNEAIKVHLKEQMKEQNT